MSVTNVDMDSLLTKKSLIAQRGPKHSVSAEHFCVWVGFHSRDSSVCSVNNQLGTAACRT